MESGDELLYDEDSGNELEDDDDAFGMEMEPEPSSTHDKRDAEEFPFEVLTAEQIVHHMVDTIKEVNAIVEVCMVYKELLAYIVVLAIFLWPWVGYTQKSNLLLRCIIYTGSSIQRKMLGTMDSDWWLNSQT